MTADPYAVLGLSPGATLDEVRSARRRLAAQFHPDHGGDAAKMGEINVAFDAVVSQLLHRTTGATPSHRWISLRHRADTQSSKTPRRSPSTISRRGSRRCWSSRVDGEVLVDDPPYVLEAHLTEPPHAGAGWTSCPTLSQHRDVDRRGHRRNPAPDRRSPRCMDRQPQPPLRLAAW